MTELRILWHVCPHCHQLSSIIYIVSIKIFQDVYINGDYDNFVELSAKHPATTEGRYYACASCFNEIANSDRKLFDYIRKHKDEIKNALRKHAKELYGKEINDETLTNLQVRNLKLDNW